jgi:conjugal transfer ATP-binding protein TraC
MEVIKAQKAMLERQPLSEFLPYLAYNDKNGIYVLDHGVGFIFECQPLIFAGEDSSKSIRGLLESSFIPAKTSIQFMMYASPNIHAIVDEYVLARQNTHGDSIYTQMAKQRRDYLLNGTNKPIFKGSELKVRNFRCFVSVSIPSEKTPQAIAASVDRAAKIKEIVAQSLNTAFLQPQNMPPQKLINLLSEMLNPGHERENYHYSEKLPIKDQVILTDTIINITKDYLLLDGKYCKSFTVKQFPDAWDISKGCNFIGDLFENARQITAPFILTLNCEFPEPVKVMADLKKKSMMANYQAFGQFSKWFPKLSLKKQHFDDFVMEIENGNSPFYAYLNLIVYADSEKEAYDLTGACVGLFRSMNFSLQEDNYIMMPLFLQSLPCGYLQETQKVLRRRRTLLTTTVADLMPIQSDWKGNGNTLPVFSLVSRRGQVQNFDIFNNPMGGFSGIVAASTGAGKSFFINDLTMSYLGVGAKIWTIDVGRSYEKLCKFLGGDFIAFDKISNICINPFSKVVDIDDEMSMLKAIVAQMVSSEKLDELSLAFIEEAIKERYNEKGNKMTITDISNYLLAGDDERQRDVGKRLYPYTSSGAYASFFEGESNLSPKAQYVVLELEELKAKKDLQEVVLLTLIYQIQQEIVFDRSARKIVIIDEAWDLLTGGNTTQFMQTGYRRFRKYKGACISVTQSINDFYKIPAGVAIIENSDFMFLLRQRPESIEALKQSQRVSLNEGLYDVLKSVHTDTGNYSEVFVYTPLGVTVGRLSVDRFTQLLYSSKAEEYSAVKKQMELGFTISDAINNVIKEEQRLN